MKKNLQSSLGLWLVNEGPKTKYKYTYVPGGKPEKHKAKTKDYNGKKRIGTHRIGPHINIYERMELERSFDLGMELLTPIEPQIYAKVEQAYTDPFLSVYEDAWECQGCWDADCTNPISVTYY